MSEKEMNSESERLRQERRWAIITSLLSLDVVLPFYGLMGINIIDPIKLMNLLRVEILDIRKETRIEPIGGPYYSAQRIISSIKNSMGQKVCSHVLWWEDAIFDDSPEDHEDLWNWKDVLRTCRSEKEFRNELILPDNYRKEFFKTFDKHLDQSSYDRIYSNVYCEPLSDWDLHMYAVNEYNDDDDENEGIVNGPDSWVHPACRVFQDFKFWAWVLKYFSLEELTALCKSANNLVFSHESVYTSRELILPRYFDIGL